MDVPPWAWWLVPLGAFLGLEAAALLGRGEHGTATSLIRRVAGIRPVRPWRPVGVALIVGFCVWLGAHLITGKV